MKIKLGLVGGIYTGICSWFGLKDLTVVGLCLCVFVPSVSNFQQLRCVL